MGRQGVWPIVLLRAALVLTPQPLSIFLWLDRLGCSSGTEVGFHFPHILHAWPALDLPATRLSALKLGLLLGKHYGDVCTAQPQAIHKTVLRSCSLYVTQHSLQDLLFTMLV